MMPRGLCRCPLRRGPWSFLLLHEEAPPERGSASGAHGFAMWRACKNCSRTTVCSKERVTGRGGGQDLSPGAAAGSLRQPLNSRTVGLEAFGTSLSSSAVHVHASRANFGSCPKASAASAPNSAAVVNPRGYTDFRNIQLPVECSGPASMPPSAAVPNGHADAEPAAVPGPPAVGRKSRRKSGVCFSEGN